MPAISVPLMQGANGLPLGVQLVGPRHGDARLLRTARWLLAHVGPAESSAEPGRQIAGVIREGPAKGPRAGRAGGGALLRLTDSGLPATLSPSFPR